MKALQDQAVVPTSLVGALGDVFWDLPAVLSYIAGQEIHCTVYVGNTTDESHSYMLRLVSTRGEVAVSEGTLRVNNRAWFDLGAWEYGTLPGSILPGDSDVLLTLELVDRETMEVADSVSVSLITPTLAELGIWGGGTPATVAADTTSSMISSIMPILLLTMIMGIFVPKKEKGK